VQVEQSFTDKALMSVQGTPGAKLWANEPYYQPDTRYQGVPKYMDENVNPWWPKVDCADQMPGSKDCYPEWVRAKIKADNRVSKSKWNLEDAAGPWNVPERLKKYRVSLSAQFELETKRT
jgi:hypothetical protein